MSTAHALMGGGALLEFFGLLLVIWELLDTQVRRFGVPRWLRPLAWLLRVVGLAPELTIRPFSVRAEAKAGTPGLSIEELPATTVEERLGVLERQVGDHTLQLAALHRRVGEEVERLEAKIADRLQELEALRSAEAEHERELVRASLRRQSLSAAFIAGGLALGTVGNLL